MKPHLTIACLLLTAFSSLCSAHEISGFARLRGELPKNCPCHLTIQLLDTSLADVRATTLNKKTIMAIKETTIPFSLKLPEVTYDKKRRITISATLTQHGKTLFRTMESYPVDAGNPEKVYHIDLLPIKKQME